MGEALVLSPNRWDGILDVGIFKFARFLQKMGYRVEHANLENPITYLKGKGGITHRMLRPLPNRWMRWRWLWSLTFHLQPYGGLRREWDLLMTDASPLLYFANRVRAKVRIYRMNDHLAGFGVPDVIVEEERRFIERSDVILVAHRRLLKDVPKEKAVYLPNPVDLSLFPVEGDFPEPEDLKPVPRPRVIYVGAIAEWFDWETLTYIARNVPEVSFVVVGPLRASPPPLPSNVFLLGPKPHVKVHLYLRHSDAALIPFRLSPLIEAMDFPNKVLEYFALGLPTVSVRWESFANNFPDVLFYTSPEEATERVREALKRGKDPTLRRLVLPYSTERSFEVFKGIVEKLHGGGTYKGLSEGTGL